MAEINFETMTPQQIQAELDKLDAARIKAKAAIERKQNENINVMVATTINDLRSSSNLTWKQIRYFAKEMTTQCVGKEDTPAPETPAN